jgi:hypothetical protein
MEVPLGTVFSVDPRPHRCMSLDSNAELVVRQSPASKDVYTESEQSTALKSLPDNQ